jgi:hypothetical protein
LLSFLPPFFDGTHVLTSLVEVRRAQGATVAEDFTMSVEAPISIPQAAPFTPRRVPYQLVEAISPIAPMGRVKHAHGAGDQS